MFIMSFSWLVDNSYLCHLLAVAPYQSLGQMVISTLMLKWHLKMDWVHLAHSISPSLQKWQRCIHWWERLCYRNFSFDEQRSVTFSRATSLRYWISHSHTFWAALERQGIWQDPSGRKGGAMRSLPKAKVCSETAAAVLQSQPCLLLGKQCPVSPGQNSAAADS